MYLKFSDDLLVGVSRQNPASEQDPDLDRHQNITSNPGPDRGIKTFNIIGINKGEYRAGRFKKISGDYETSGNRVIVSARQSWYF
jgi:hypothetical protein